MTVTINIPDTQATRIVTAICNTFGYQANIPDVNNPGQTIPNPQTQAQFAKQQLVNFIMGVVSNYEAEQAAQTARTTAVNKVNTQISMS